MLAGASSGHSEVPVIILCKGGTHPRAALSIITCARASKRERLVALNLYLNHIKRVSRKRDISCLLMIKRAMEKKISKLTRLQSQPP